MSTNNMKISIASALALATLVGTAHAGWIDPSSRSFASYAFSFRPPIVQPVRFAGDPEDLQHPVKIVVLPVGPSSPMAHVDVDEEIAGIDSGSPRPGVPKGGEEEDGGDGGDALGSVYLPDAPTDPFLPRILGRNPDGIRPANPGGWHDPQPRIIDPVAGNTPTVGEREISTIVTISTPGTSGSAGTIPAPGALMIGVVGALGACRRRRA